MLDFTQKESIWLERMLNKANMVTSYKVYWLKGIISEIIESGGNIQVLSFDRIVCRMIVEAWYPLIQYKLNFGIQDQLGKVVNYLNNTYDYGPEIKKNFLMNELYYSEILKSDKIFQKMKKNFYYMVPYRLINPFFEQETKGIKDQKKNRLISELAQDNDECMYRIDHENKRIVLSRLWVDYIMENQSVIIGWLQFKLIGYLQNKNLSVPNIIMKLEPPAKRNLQKATKYWKKVNQHKPIRDIYTSKPMAADNYLEHGGFSIDHFVPWSFVLHDELWNLLPTFKHVNSIKSDRLPKLEKYLESYCHIHYEAFEFMKRSGKHKKHMEDYLSIGGRLGSMEILNPDIQVGEEAFVDSMKSAIMPVYQIAYNQGFEVWEYN